MLYSIQTLILTVHLRTDRLRTGLQTSDQHYVEWVGKVCQGSPGRLQDEYFHSSSEASGVDSPGCSTSPSISFNSSSPSSGMISSSLIGG